MEKVEVLGDLKQDQELSTTQSVLNAVSLAKYLLSRRQVSLFFAKSATGREGASSSNYSSFFFFFLFLLFFKTAVPPLIIGTAKPRPSPPV